MKHNATSWFEIPASNLKRAADFYGKVIGDELSIEQMGAHEMAVFPFDRGAGVGGCVLVADYLKPGEQGNLVYLIVKGDIDAALSRAQQAGARVVHEKTALPGSMGHYAHIIDSEGNRIGLHAA